MRTAVLLQLFVFLLHHYVHAAKNRYLCSKTHRI